MEPLQLHRCEHYKQNAIISSTSVEISGKLVERHTYLETWKNKKLFARLEDRESLFFVILVRVFYSPRKHHPAHCNLAHTYRVQLCSA